MPTDLENYLFDLRGYIVLEKAVDSQHLLELNTCLDSYRDLEPQQWRGNVHRADNFYANGIEIQNVVEAGEPFERLIKERKLQAFRYDGFWTPMDTAKDRQRYDELWASGNTPWTVWRQDQAKPGQR